MRFSVGRSSLGQYGTRLLPSAQSLLHNVIRSYSSAGKPSTHRADAKSKDVPTLARDRLNCERRSLADWSHYPLLVCSSVMNLYALDSLTSDVIECSLSGDALTVFATSSRGYLLAPASAPADYKSTFAPIS
jgi:hypothetical protein